MTQQSYSDVSPALAQTYGTDFTRIWNNSARTLSRIRAKQLRQRNVAWDVQFGDSGTGAATAALEGADFATPSQYTPKSALLNWVTYQSTFAVTDFVAAASAAQMGQPSELNDLVMDNIITKGWEMGKKLNKDFFVSTGSLGVTGMAGALITSGQYAGLDVGTYPTFAANTDSTGGVPRSLDAALMDKMEAQIFAACGERPDLIVMNQKTANKYKALFQSVITQFAGTISAGSRFDVGPNPDNLAYAGIEILRDVDCPDGYVYFLNTRHVEFLTLPLDMGAMTRGQNFVGVTLARDYDGATGQPLDIGLPIAVVALARTGTAQKFGMYSFVQVRVKSPFTCGVITDIDVAGA